MGLADTRWDELCPYCESKIDVDIRSQFEAADYRDTFDFECPFCNRMVHVDVHRVPEFQLSRTATDVDEAGCSTDGQVGAAVTASPVDGCPGKHRHAGR